MWIKKSNRNLIMWKEIKKYIYILPFYNTRRCDGEERREDRRERNVTKKKRRMKSRAGECETGGYWHWEIDGGSCPWPGGQCQIRHLGLLPLLLHMHTHICNIWRIFPLSCGWLPLNNTISTLNLNLSNQNKLAVCFYMINAGRIKTWDETGDCK